jgi:hypothetical protein
MLLKFSNSEGVYVIKIRFLPIVYVNSERGAKGGVGEVAREYYSQQDDDDDQLLCRMRQGRGRHSKDVQIVYAS